MRSRRSCLLSSFDSECGGSQEIENRSIRHSKGIFDDPVRRHESDNPRDLKTLQYDPRDRLMYSFRAMCCGSRSTKSEALCGAAALVGGSLAGSGRTGARAT